MRAGHFAQLFRGSLLLLGQAIPDQQAWRKPVRLALAGVALATAVGTLGAIALVAGLTGLYFYLASIGYTPSHDALAVVAVAAVLLVIGYQLGRRWIGELPGQVHAFYHPKNLLSEMAQELVGGFVDGLTRKAHDAVDEGRAAIDDEIERLLARIEELEKAHEATDEVVLEIQHSRKNPRKR